MPSNSGNIPLVSVIMPVYNTAGYIKEAIESVLQQTYTNLELVIVNDGSTDNTPEIILSFTDPRIRYIDLVTNRGRGFARNHAISNCRGAYIAVCDGDDIQLPERIEKQVRFLEANPGIDIIGTQILHFVDGHPPSRLYHFPEAPEAIAMRYKKGVMGIAHCSVLLRSRCFEEERYDDSLAYSVEDLELFLRLNRKHKMVSLPDALVHYRNNQFKKISYQQIAYHQLYHDYSLHIAEAKLKKLPYENFENWRKKAEKSVSYQLKTFSTYLKIRAKLLLLNFKR